MTEQCDSVKHMSPIGMKHLASRPSIFRVPMLHTCQRACCCAPEYPRECVRVFTSEKARQAHRSRAHGHRAMARDFVSDEQCPACGKVFGSSPMAIEHLQCRAQRCRRNMLDGPITQTLSSCDSSRGRARSDCWSDEVHGSSFSYLTPQG